MSELALEIFSNDYQGAYQGSVTTSFLRYIPEQEGEIHEWTSMNANRIEFLVPFIGCTSVDPQFVLRQQDADEELQYQIVGNQVELHVTGAYLANYHQDVQVNVNSNYDCHVGSTWSVDCSDAVVEANVSSTRLVSNLFSEVISDSGFVLDSTVPIEHTYPSSISHVDTSINVHMGDTSVHEWTSDHYSFTDTITSTNILVSTTGIAFVGPDETDTTSLLRSEGTFKVLAPDRFMVFDPVVGPDPVAVAMAIQTGTQQVSFGDPTDNTVLPLTAAAVRIVRTDLRESSIEWTHDDSLAFADLSWTSVAPLSSQQKEQARNGGLDLVQNAPHVMTWNIPGDLLINLHSQDTMTLSYDHFRVGSTTQQVWSETVGVHEITEHLVHTGQSYLFPNLNSSTDTWIVQNTPQHVFQKTLVDSILDNWYDSTGQVVQGPATLGTTRTLATLDGPETFLNKTIGSTEGFGHWTWNDSSQLTTSWIEHPVQLCLGATTSAFGPSLVIGTTCMSMWTAHVPSSDISFGGRIAFCSSTDGQSNLLDFYDDSGVKQASLAPLGSGLNLSLPTHSLLISSTSTLSSLVQFRNTDSLSLDYHTTLNKSFKQNVFIGPTATWRETYDENHWSRVYVSNPESSLVMTNSGKVAIGKGSTYVPSASLEVKGSIVTDNDLTSVEWKGAYDHAIIENQNPHRTSLEQVRMISNQVEGHINFLNGSTVTGVPFPATGDQVANKAYVDSFLDGVFMQQSIVTRQNQVPPEDPEPGDRYIAAVGSTGDWAGLDNYVVEWKIDPVRPAEQIYVWYGIEPSPGMITFAVDESAQIIYVGTQWTRLSSITNHSELQNLNTDDHLQYARLNGRSGGQIMSGGSATSENLYLESTYNRGGGAGTGFVGLNALVGGHVRIGSTTSTVSEFKHLGTQPYFQTIGTSLVRSSWSDHSSTLNWTWKDSVSEYIGLSPFEMILQNGSLSIGCTGEYNLNVNGTTDTNHLQTDWIHPRPDENLSVLHFGSTDDVRSEFRIHHDAAYPAAVVFTNDTTPSDPTWFLSIHETNLSIRAGDLVDGVSSTTSGCSIGVTGMSLQSESSLEFLAITDESLTFQIETSTDPLWSWLNVQSNRLEWETNEWLIQDRDGVPWLELRSTEFGRQWVIGESATVLNETRPSDLSFKGSSSWFPGDQRTWSCSASCYGTYVVTQEPPVFGVGDRVGIESGGHTYYRVIQSVSKTTSSDPTGGLSGSVYVHQVSAAFPMVSRVIVSYLLISPVLSSLYRSDERSISYVTDSGWWAWNRDELPQAPFHFSTPSTRTSFQDAASTYTMMVNNAASSLSFVHSNGAAASWNLIQTSGPFSFQITNEGNPLLLLTRTGELGLGTSTPRAVLDIVPEGAYIGSFEIGLNTCSWDNEAAPPDGISCGHTNFMDTAPALFQASGSGNTRVSGSTTVNVSVNQQVQQTWTADSTTISHDLYVTEKIGVGTTSPESALDVVGTVRCTNVLTTSDERLKTDICYLSHPQREQVIESMMRTIRPALYRWKADPEKKHLGVIAQDLCPELVSRRQDGTLQVDMMDLLVGLLVWVQDLSQKISIQVNK